MRIGFRTTPEYQKKIENDKQQFKNIVTEYLGGKDTEAFAERQFQRLSEHPDFNGDNQKIKEAFSEILEGSKSILNELQNSDKLNQQFQDYSDRISETIKGRLNEIVIPNKPGEFEIRFWFDDQVIRLNEPRSTTQTIEIMESSPSLSISLPVDPKSNDPHLVEKIRKIAQEEFQDHFDRTPLPATLVMDIRLKADRIWGTDCVSYSFPACRTGLTISTN